MSITTSTSSTDTAGRVRRVLWSTRRRKVATIMTTLALLIVGVAIAQWLTSGDGEGGTKVGSLLQPTVVAGAPTGKQLLPSGLADGAFRVSNPNSTALVLTGIDYASTQTGSSSDPAGCPWQDALSPNPHAIIGGQSIPAGATDVDVLVPDAFMGATDLPNACQDATLTRSVRLTFSTP